MKICGLQKLTLLDYPEHTACTVFLGYCNFRCPYCHNKELYTNPKPIMGSNSFLEWLKSKQGKLDGVAITGGEPTLHERLPEFIRKIKDLGFLVKVDTNGYKPGVLQQLIYECKVDYVAMDIKNSPDKYDITTDVTLNFDRIEESVKIIMNSNIDYEFRTTVTHSLHNDDDFKAIGNLIYGAKNYYLQKCSTDSPLDSDLERYKTIAEMYALNVGIRG